MQLCYANLRCEKANLAHKRNPDKHSVQAVGTLKGATDMGDKYLIYKINNSQFSDDSDYTFKTSCTITQIAIDMDQEEPENPFQREEAYFEDSHLQCICYKHWPFL